MTSETHIRTYLGRRKTGATIAEIVAADPGGRGRSTIGQYVRRLCKRGPPRRCRETGRPAHTWALRQR